MKNLLIFLLAISLLTACDNNPLVSKERKTSTKDKDDKKNKKDKSETDDEYSDKDKSVSDDRYDFKDKDDGEDDDDSAKEDDEENESSGWTRARRERFVDDCVGEAKKSMTNKLATSYCDCMQFKIEKKYKMSFVEASQITSEDLSTPEAKADILQCLGK